MSRNFFVGKHVNFTRVNETEVTNKASRVNVKVEPYFRLRVIYLYRYTELVYLKVSNN